MHTDKATGIVVKRNWQTQLFYAILIKMLLISYSIFIKKLKTFSSNTTWKSSVEKYGADWSCHGASYPAIIRRSTTSAKLYKHKYVLKEKMNHKIIKCVHKNGKFSVVDGISIQITQL